MRRMTLLLVLALAASIGTGDAPRPSAAQERRVYAVWPHSDY